MDAKQLLCAVSCSVCKLYFITTLHALEDGVDKEIKERRF